MEFDSWMTHLKNLLMFEKIIIYDTSMESELINQMVKDNFLLELKSRNNSYYARSNLDDVARLESRTFICTDDKAILEPQSTNYYPHHHYINTYNWMSTTEMRTELDNLMKKSMVNRTAYIIPFVMGALDDLFSIYGLMITDSPYVTINMGIMAKVDLSIIDKINNGQPYVKCIHTVGFQDELPLLAKPQLRWFSDKTKYISHFPELNMIYSYGSGYGGNAILSKKCLALRIASYQGYLNNWYAEHMMLIKLTNKVENKTIYIAGAFPSSCGKTNMAMLKSKLPEFEVETIGDDIAWLRIINGKLYAINPETGFFGVAPGTSSLTNPVGIDTIKENTIFTNVGLLSDYSDVWWEGLGSRPDGLINWLGKETDGLISHPNARYTVRSSQCPQFAFDDDKKWVEISAIIVGGRRESTNIPLIREAHTFVHGVLMGATLSSEQTAAAEGTVGELRYDPFAMLPFCGYSIGLYLQHWLDMETKLVIKPKIYHINLFGKTDNQYIWPGYSENILILKWIYDRIVHQSAALETINGIVPFDLPVGASNNDFWLRQYQFDKTYLLSIKAPKKLVDLLGKFLSVIAKN
jgi:phosphoenolpyruvate carboxykinase (GTP)